LNEIVGLWNFFTDGALRVPGTHIPIAIQHAVAPYGQIVMERGLMTHVVPKSFWTIPIAEILFIPASKTPDTREQRQDRE
jgi:hypothetical protein